MSFSCPRSVYRNLLFVVALLISAVSVDAAGMPVRRIVPGDVPNEYIVSLQGVPREKVDAAAREIARKVDGQLVAVWKDAVTAFWIRVPAERAQQMLRDGRVKSIEQNARVYDAAVQVTGVSSGTVQPTPAGEYPSGFQPQPLWHLARISHRTRGPLYYQYQNGGTGVRAYTIDGGALRFHQEFVTVNTPAAGRHVNPAESPRLLEETGSNAIDATGGDDHLPSTAPHQDCGIATSFALTLGPLGQLRYASEYPWFMPAGMTAKPDHGTGVNSVLGGRNVGVAKDVTLVPVKTLACNGTGSIAAAIHGINWILEQERNYADSHDGARRPAVASFSTYRFLGFGASEPTSDLLIYEAAIESLVAYGIPVFASANNSVQDACLLTPSRLSRRGGFGHVMTVGGLAKGSDRQWRDPYTLTNGSNYGPCVDIIAPAEDIPVARSSGWSAYRPQIADNFQSSSGTSYSAPAVAALAARMFAEDPALVSQLKTNPAAVSKEIYDRLVGAATVLGETNGADLNAPLGPNSPNRIAYMGAIGLVSQPQSHDFVSGETSYPLSVSVPGDATVCGYDWYETDSPDYAASQTLMQTDSSNLRTSTYPAPRPTFPARKWYWVRVKTCQADEFADSAMAALSVGCAVITQQPASAWIQEGASATLSIDVQATASLKVTWYRGVRGNIGQPVSGPSTNLTFTTPDAGEYWARVTTSGASPCTIDSDVAQVRSCVPPRPFAAETDRELKLGVNGVGWRIEFNDPTKVPANITSKHLYMYENGAWQLRASDWQAGLPSFSTSTATETRKYKIVLDNACGFVESQEITAPQRCVGATARVPLSSVTSVHAGDAVILTQLDPQDTYTWLIIPDGGVARTETTDGDRFTDYPTTHTTYKTILNVCGETTTSSAGVTVSVRPLITTQPPANVLKNYESAGVAIHADGADPAGLSVTYQWYDGETQSKITDMPGATTAYLGARRGGTYFLRVTSSKGTTLSTDTKYATVTETCSKPRRRAIRFTSSGTPGGNLTIPAGSVLTLKVDDYQDGTTFQWFEGTSYTDESKLVGTTATVLVTPLHSTSYWAKMTMSCGTASESETTDPFNVLVQCTPEIQGQPQSVTKPMTAAGTTVTSMANVIAAGTGPFVYQWYEINADNSRTAVAGQNTSTYTWSYAVPATQPQSVQKRVQVDITACDTTVSSDIATLTVVKTTPQHIFTYGDSGFVYGPGDSQRLYVTMEPQPSATDVYTYEWFEDDGSAVGRKLGTTNTEILVATSSIATYWARITGTHTVAEASYTEVTVSPKMYIWRYGTCQLPELKVSQNYQVIPAGTSPAVTFVAVCDWPDVTLQWFKGQSGDTREPMPSDSGKPNQLTVSSGVTLPYWVRASLECGAFQDSPALTFSRSDCSPVLIDQNIASVDVAYGGSATLSVTPIMAPRPSYTWYEGPGQGSIAPGSGSSSLTLNNVIMSGRYWVKVRNLDCSISSDSYLAMVRVASCPSMTPPVWQTEVWTDIVTAKTLTATTAGASGYQWFLGEVGDDSQPIGGATLDTYTTPLLSAPAKYWVRAYGSGCAIDSPTITVHICEPPHVVTPINFTRNITPGQQVVFKVDVAGTDLSYQWYQGAPGDTTTPIGQPVDRLEITPSATSEYWVRVTGKCGADGTDTRVYDISTFEASVCPSVQVPAAATTTVMMNATTTLSIIASGSGLTYQWYKGEPGDRSQPLANGAAATVTTPPITGTTSFWCEVKSGNCSASSEAVVVGLCSEPTVQWSHGDKFVTKGEYVTFLAAAVHSTEQPLYTFYKGNAGDVAGSTVARAESSSYYFSAIVTETANYWVRARVDNCTADTTNITISVCIPKITTQPAAGSITSGASYPLSVVSDIPPVNGYQWYIGDTGVTTNPVAGGTTASITVTPTTDTKYWVQVKGCGATKADSTAALVSVCTKPLISSSTPSYWVTKGTPAPLLVSTSAGNNLTYRWYHGVTGNTATQVGTNASFSESPADTTQYWARVSNGCGSADTPTITISVCAPPAITVQPISQPVFSGKSATLSVTATEATSTPMTYQWYLGTPGSGTAISGATANTYTTGPLTANTSYWVRVTAGTCATDSDAAMVSMCAYNEVFSGPSDRDIAIGQTTRLQVSPISPLPDQVRWYRGVQGDKTTLISSNTYVDVNPTATTQYWGEFTGGGCTAKTRTVTAFVSIPTITTQPVNTLTNGNTAATLTVAANTVGVTYQWYAGTSGSGTAIAGEIAPSYTTPVNAAGTTASYWVKVTGSHGATVNSNTAVVTWCNPASITSAPASRNITRGASTWLSVNATGTNLQYAWYRGTTGVETSPLGTGSISNGGATSSLSVSPTNPEKYWVKVTSACGSVNSPTVNVDVCVSPTINTQPMNQTTFSGTSATLTVAATAGTALPLSYQWYDAATNQPVAGATSASFTTPSLTAETTYFVRVTSGVCTTDSDIVTVSMCAYGATTNAPSDVNIYAGQAIALKVTRTPAAEATNWYRGVSGDRTYLIGTSSQVTVAPTVTTQYWGEFTYGDCTSIGRTVTLNVCVAKITTQPASATIARYATKTLSVTATSAASYQWYAGAGSGTPITGATSYTYTTPSLSATTSYWVRVTGSCGSAADSNLATVTVN
jgi:hypothetical protein